MDLKLIVNKIREKDMVIGTLAEEALYCANSKKFIAAIACLAILQETTVKQVLQKVDGNLSKQIHLLRKKNILSDKETDILTEFRTTRNKLFHESHYAWVVEIEGKASFFSEHETKEHIWGNYASKIIQICQKLLDEMNNGETDVLLPKTSSEKGS